MKSIMRSHDVSVRKSPSVSATAFPVGYRMVGNDGNMWQIVSDSRGVQRWQKQAGGGYDTGNWQAYVPKKKKPAEKPEKKMPRMKGVTFIQDEDLQEKEDVGARKPGSQDRPPCAPLGVVADVTVRPLQP